ncbi:hypothetical protein HNY73_011686 [Argiope bruennichi]|uniref:Uncharacterized protein n=1 Tax=Argiope bruennichi TaxID=94029 RepID=A0A8T0EZV5_ARGBR|nr:hypothetical protein HNY73_011686 [Argiope bruennichi]
MLKTPRPIVNGTGRVVGAPITYSLGSQARVGVVVRPYAFIASSGLIEPIDSQPLLDSLVRVFKTVGWVTDLLPLLPATSQPPTGSAGIQRGRIANRWATETCPCALRSANPCAHGSRPPQNGGGRRGLNRLATHGPATSPCRREPANSRRDPRA